jgi:hypothetical protein
MAAARAALSRVAVPASKKSMRSRGLKVLARRIAVWSCRAPGSGCEGSTSGGERTRLGYPLGYLAWIRTTRRRHGAPTTLRT